jgi:two-component system response regulator FixJ
MTGHEGHEGATDTVETLAQQIVDLPPKDRARMFHHVATLSRQRRSRFRSTDPLLEMARRGRGLLTLREEQVLQLLVSGFANKEMATMLDLSIRTVELHRSRMMHKMLARNAADLCRIMALLEPEDEQVDAA